MSSNSYIAKIKELTTSRNRNGNIRNPERAFKAMKHIGKDMNKVVKAEYVVDLFKDLRQKNTPLRTVTDTFDKLCNDIKPEQKTQVIKSIMKFKQQSAYRTLERAKRQYTKTNNENKQELVNNNIYREAINTIRNEKKKQRQNHKIKRKRKVKHLERIQDKRNKNNQNKQIQETTKIEGIIIENQEIPQNYEPKINKYGNVNITKDEEEALLLPPKLCVYTDVNKLECETEVEKAMVKLRWSSKKHQKRELTVSSRGWISMMMARWS